MTPYVRRLLRAALPPPQRPKHREDRLKALAGAFQTVALAIVAVGLVTPAFNTPEILTGRKMLAAASMASLLEGISLLILLYVPYKDDREN